MGKYFLNVKKIIPTKNINNQYIVYTVSIEINKTAHVTEIGL